MKLVLETDEKFDVKITPKDASGDETTNLGGRSVAFEVNDPDIATVTVDESNPLLLHGVAGQKAGTAQIVVRLQKEGVPDIIGDCEVETLPGEVEKIELAIEKAE